MIEKVSPESALSALCHRALGDSVLFAEMQLAVASPIDHHPMHDFMHQLIDCCEKSVRRNKVAIVMPPGHGKSKSVAQRLVWEQGHNPGLKTALVSANDELSKETMIWIRNSFLNPVTKLVFPHLEPDVDRSRDGRGGGWSNTQLYFRGCEFPSFEVKSLFGSNEGGRYDRILLDDCVTRDVQQSIVLREKVQRALSKTWYRRVNNPDSRCIMLNNVWHPEDAVHKLIEAKSATVFWLGYEGFDRMWWRVYNPPETWPHGESGFFPLWDRLSAEALEDIYAEDPHTFEHLYRGRAMAAEDCPFPHRDEWGTYDRVPEPHEGGRLIAFMDPSGGKNVAKNCYAACILVMVTAKREILVLDAIVERAPVNEQVQWPFRLAAKWIAKGYEITETGVEILAKEDEWILPILRREEDRRREAGEEWRARVVARRPKENKESRIQSLIPKFVHKEIKFPAGFREMVKGSTREARWWRQLVDQTEYYRGEKVGFVDAPDALAGAVYIADKMYVPKRTTIDTDAPVDNVDRMIDEHVSFMTAQSRIIRKPNGEYVTAAKALKDDFMDRLYVSWQ